MVAPSRPKSQRSLPVYPSQRSAADYPLPTIHCPLSFFPCSNAQLLCFLSHPCNPSSFIRLRTLLRNGAPYPSYFQWLPHSFYRHGGVPSATSVPACAGRLLTPRPLCCAFPGPWVLKRANSFVCIDLEPLCCLFTLFSTLVSFVFKSLQPLFRKYRGWGIPNATTGHPGGGWSL
jgi:hypothetical protein